MAIFNIMMDMSLKHKSSNWYKKKKIWKIHVAYHIQCTHRNMFVSYSLLWSVIEIK